MEPKTLEYKLINRRAYARIIDSNGEHLWRTRHMDYDQSFECQEHECKNMNQFIKLADKELLSMIVRW